MADGLEDENVPAATISLLGALAVLLVYWAHLALLELPLVNDTGVSLTVLISAFLAQYIPLKIMKRED